MSNILVCDRPPDASVRVTSCRWWRELVWYGRDEEDVTMTCLRVVCGLARFDEVTSPTDAVPLAYDIMRASARRKTIMIERRRNAILWWISSTLYVDNFTAVNVGWLSRMSPRREWRIDGVGNATKAPVPVGPRHARRLALATANFGRDERYARTALRKQSVCINRFDFVNEARHVCRRRRPVGSATGTADGY